MSGYEPLAGVTGLIGVEAMQISSSLIPVAVSSKTEMKMARLWEDTLVLALRDRQWCEQAAELKSRDTAVRTYPSTFLKLDGRAEETLADLIVEENERFYLLEVKSTQALIHEEWKRRQGVPKWAYFRLTATLEEASDPAVPDRDRAYFRSMLHKSLRCHQFAYWMEYEEGANDVRTEIMVESYLGGCSRHSALRPTEHTSTMAQFAETFAMGYATAPGQYDVVTQIPYADLRNNVSRVLTTGFIDDQRVVRSSYIPGLPLDSFIKYLQFLCEEHDDGDEAIHAVILSSTGQFTRVVTTIRELEEVTKTAPEPAPLALEDRIVFSCRHVPPPSRQVSGQPASTLAESVEPVISGDEPKLRPRRRKF